MENNQKPSRSSAQTGLGTENSAQQKPLSGLRNDGLSPGRLQGGTPLNQPTHPNNLRQPVGGQPQKGIPLRTPIDGLPTPEPVTDLTIRVVTFARLACPYCGSTKNQKIYGVSRNRTYCYVRCNVCVYPGPRPPALRGGYTRYKAVLVPPPYTKRDITPAPKFSSTEGDPIPNPTAPTPVNERIL